MTMPKSRRRQKKNKDVDDDNDSIWGMIAGLTLGGIALAFLSEAAKPNCPICNKKITHGVTVCPSLLCKHIFYQGSKQADRRTVSSDHPTKQEALDKWVKRFLPNPF